MGSSLPTDMRSVVVLPTYNEAENIALFLQAVREAAPMTDVLVVDDNSPDGTGAIAESVAEEIGGVTVLHRPGKAGLGSAYREGFGRVLDGRYDVVVSMDADFSHDPGRIPEFIEAIENGADLVIGSRYVRGGGTTDWPVRRQLRLLSRQTSLEPTSHRLSSTTARSTARHRQSRSPPPLPMRLRLPMLVWLRTWLSAQR